jgi:hypothetical protein
MTSDGLRDFQYDVARRFSKVRIFKAAKPPASWPTSRGEQSRATENSVDKFLFAW